MYEVYVQATDFVTRDMIRTGHNLKANANTIGSVRVAQLAYLASKIISRRA